MVGMVSDDFLRAIPKDNHQHVAFFLAGDSDKNVGVVNSIDDLGGGGNLRVDAEGLVDFLLLLAAIIDGGNCHSGVLVGEVFEK